MDRPTDRRTDKHLLVSVSKLGETLDLNILGKEHRFLKGTKFLFAEELKKSHAMFFQAHDIQLVNEDIGAGILHGDNAYSYDLAPVSSSTGFMNWAKKTFDQFLSPFSFLTEGLGYMIMVIIGLIILIT